MLDYYSSRNVKLKYYLVRVIQIIVYYCFPPSYTLRPLHKKLLCIEFVLKTPEIPK